MGEESLVDSVFPSDWLCEYRAITKSTNLFADFTTTEIINLAMTTHQRNGEIITDESILNWEKTSGEMLTREQMVFATNFWAQYVNKSFELSLPQKTPWEGWDSKATVSDMASVILSIWVWDSNNGLTNGDSWYEIPYLKPAIFFGWSIQNNSMDVMRKNVNHLRRRYLLNFEMTKDVGFFQGIGIGTFWLSHLLTGVATARSSDYYTLRDLAVVCWLYNSSTRKPDCISGQFWRDIMTGAFGEKNQLWYEFGLDVEMESLLEYLDVAKLEKFTQTLP